MSQKNGIKKVDALITGVILGGVIGSIYGIKKLKDHKESHPQSSVFDISTPEPKKSWWSRWFSRK